jgi:hypothetical protein
VRNGFVPRNGGNAPPSGPERRAAKGRGFSDACMKVLKNALTGRGNRGKRPDLRNQTSRGKHNFGQGGSRNQARLPQLRRAVLRPSEAADRMPEMRIQLRAGVSLQATSSAPARAGRGRTRSRRARRGRRGCRGGDGGAEAEAEVAEEVIEGEPASSSLTTKTTRRRRSRRTDAGRCRHVRRRADAEGADIEDIVADGPTRRGRRHLARRSRRRRRRRQRHHRRRHQGRDERFSRRGGIFSRSPTNPNCGLPIWKWGHSSVGRALEWHSRGQRFDPAWLHHHPSLLRSFGWQACVPKQRRVPTKLQAKVARRAAQLRLARPPSLRGGDQFIAKNSGQKSSVASHNAATL